MNPGEMRAEREAVRADARADHPRIEASMNQMRAEGRADREAFAMRMARILEQQGNLDDLFEDLRHPLPSSEE